MEQSWHQRVLKVESLSPIIFMGQSFRFKTYINLNGILGALCESILMNIQHWVVWDTDYNWHSCQGDTDQRSSPRPCYVGF